MLNVFHPRWALVAIAVVFFLAAMLCKSDSRYDLANYCISVATLALVVRNSL
jgi:cellobiose-specific phosphotransferase system component IIC